MTNKAKELVSIAGITTGTGSDSKHIESMMEEAETYFNESGSRSVKYGNLVDDLITEHSRGLKGGVDNYGAHPVKNAAYIAALSFAQVLPLDLNEDVEEYDIKDSPEAGLEPDGGMSFDWENEDTGASFVVSFIGDGKIYFAGLFKDGSRTNGSCYFHGNNIPDDIIRGIKKVFK